MGKSCFGKRMEGSFTVEASVIVPFLIFVLIAFLYAVFFVHDTGVMAFGTSQAGEILLARQYAAKYDNRSFGSRSGTDIPQEIQDTLKHSVILMRTGGMSAGKGGSLFGDLYHSAKSIRSVTVSAEGSLGIDVPGAAQFLGHRMKKKQASESIWVDYPDDWFKQHFLKGLEGE